jgi:hypothetical protein
MRIFVKLNRYLHEPVVEFHVDYTFSHNGFLAISHIVYMADLVRIAVNM